MNRRMVGMLFLLTFTVAIAMICYRFGYQMGKATPCTDEESFEIHPMPGP